MEQLRVVEFPSPNGDQLIKQCSMDISAVQIVGHVFPSPNGDYLI